jgi:hypothetical protein
LTYAVRDASQNWVTKTSSARHATKIAAVQLNGWNFPSSTSTVYVSPSPISKTSNSSPGQAQGIPNPGLSGGAKVGVGVAIAVGFLLMLSVAAYLVVVRRRQATMLLIPDEPMRDMSGVREVEAARESAKAGIDTVSPARPPSV